MQLDITKYPEPVLARRADDVTEFDDALRELVENMFETMYAVAGVGLAAPQVGVSKRIFVMDCTTEDDPTEPLTMINPEVLEYDGEDGGSEGCLSVPEVFAPLARPTRVRARGQDLTGAWFEVEKTGLEARCIMHETDHLDGRLFIDRLSPLKRDMVKRKLRKRQRFAADE